MKQNSLHSLGDLRLLKKDLALDDDKDPAQQPTATPERKRSKTVVHPSRAEEHARNEGLTRGQKVRLMDTSDTATIVGFGQDCYELDLDGLVIRAVRSEFIPIDPEQDRLMRASIPARKPHKTASPQPTDTDPQSDLTVDLHFDRIPGNEGIPEWAALDFQMNYFRQVLRQNLRHRGRRITFVHGIGDGILAAALRKELDESFALSCTYTIGPMDATRVTIK